MSETTVLHRHRHMRFLSAWNEIGKHAFRFEFWSWKRKKRKNKNQRTNTEIWIARANKICLHLLVMMEHKEKNEQKYFQCQDTGEWWTELTYRKYFSQRQIHRLLCRLSKKNRQRKPNEKAIRRHASVLRRHITHGHLSLIQWIEQSEHGIRFLFFSFFFSCQCSAFHRFHADYSDAQTE